MAEGPQPPPERGGGLAEAKSAAHSIQPRRLRVARRAGAGLVSNVSKFSSLLDNNGLKKRPYGHSLLPGRLRRCAPRRSHVCTHGASFQRGK